MFATVHSNEVKFVKVWITGGNRSNKPLQTLSMLFWYSSSKHTMLFGMFAMFALLLSTEKKNKA